MKKTVYIVGAACGMLLIIFLGFDPNKLPSFMLVLPFILLFIALAGALFLILQKQGITRNKSMQIAGLGASFPVLILVLQSIGQLTVRDVLVVTVLFILSYFYISRTAVSS